MSDKIEQNLMMHVCRQGRLWVLDMDHPSRQAIAYESIADYANEQEPLVDWATEEVTEFTPAALQEAVANFYRQYGTDEEKLAYGVDDRPYSVCIYCHRLVRWDHDLRELVDPDATSEPTMCHPPRERGVAYAEHGHQSKWLTMGEFRDRTEHLPDTFPITLDAQGPDAPKDTDSWYNVRLTEVPSTEDLERGDAQPSLLLDIADDFDTRQW